MFENVTHSPFENRCSYLHSPDTMSKSDAVTLPVKAKKHGGAGVIVDPLFHAYRTVIHQKNSIISPHSWEKCRPSSASTQESKASELDDTYRMVCNNPSADNNVLPIASVEHDLEDELKKLCIVNKMVGNDTRHNFTYDPQNSKCLPCCSISFLFYITHIKR